MTGEVAGLSDVMAESQDMMPTAATAYQTVVVRMRFGTDRTVITLCFTDAAISLWGLVEVKVNSEFTSHRRRPRRTALDQTEAPVQHVNQAARDTDVAPASFPASERFGRVARCPQKMLHSPSRTATCRRGGRRWTIDGKVAAIAKLAVQ